MLMKMRVGMRERQSGLLLLAYIIISRKARDLMKPDAFEGGLLLKVVLTLENSLKIPIKHNDPTQTNKRQLLRIIVKRTSQDWDPFSADQGRKAEDSKKRRPPGWEIKAIDRLPMCFTGL